MRLTLNLLLTLVLSQGILVAQSVPVPLCGNDLLRDILHQHHPELAENMEQTFQWVQKQQSQLRGTLTIPVVIHVVWKEAAENLSDELIASQIEVLNQDFSRMNPDTGNLRAIFNDVAGNADIQFEVKAINRVQTDETFGIDFFSGTLAPELKSTAIGGADAWDPELHLNIWICKIQPITIGPLVLGQILGFAFPPANLPNWPSGANAPQPGEDGVVIDYRVWGLNNPNPVEIPGGGGNLDIRGRTPVHEIGHYLGLRHIWGDGGILGPNDCQQSDGVDDTPHANSQSNFDCDKTKNTCTAIEPFYGMDMPDLVENFMDYSNETCMNMFTKGQVEIMRNVLSGPRAGLVSGSSNLSHGRNGRPGWKLFPNPANQQAQIQLDVPATETTSIHLYDTQGQLHYSGALPLGGQYLEIPIAHLPSGIYVVTCRDNQHISHQRLIVQHSN